MSSIYIHIPFCKQKCNYCNFHSSASHHNKNELIECLLEEIRLQKKYLEQSHIPPLQKGIKGNFIETIYFGGGTPSLLSINEINLIIEEISKYHKIIPAAEITLEANPDDLTKQKAKELRNYTPINRLSIGVQSFFDDDLKYLNRLHDSRTSLNAVKIAYDTGFENITIDLIYGIPTLSNKNWGKNLHTAFDLKIPHLSCYCLTIEDKTPLKLFIERGKAIQPDENQAIQHFQILLSLMKKNNYIQYEISNFGKQGYFSRHNISYWKGIKYLGIGPSAHSYNGKTRQWNLANNTEYIKSIKSGIIPATIENLTPQQKYNEYVMTSLRTIWGCDVNYIKNTFGEKMAEYCLQQAMKFCPPPSPTIKSGGVKNPSKRKREKSFPLMVGRKRGLLLTDKGKLFADRITAEMFALPCP